MKSTRQFLEDQRQEFERDMLDLENMRYCLKQEQKRADDAVGQIEKLNDEVNIKKSFDDNRFISQLGERSLDL